MAGTYLLEMIILFLYKFKTASKIQEENPISHAATESGFENIHENKKDTTDQSAITNSENRKQSESHTQIKKHSYQRPSETSFDKWLLPLFTTGRIAQYSRHRQNKQNSCNPLQPHNVVIQSQQKCAEDKKCRQLHIP